MQQVILFQILMIILKKRKITRDYLANRFELSKRTISRYVLILIDAGIPITITHGQSGGYSIADDYLLHNIYFNDTDIDKMITLLKDANDKHSKSIIEKLEASHAAKASHEYIIKQENMLIDSGDFTNPEFFRDKIQMFNLAIEQERTVDMMYTDARQFTSYRDFDPYTLILKSGVWYVYGMCHLRSSFRTFKLSRIRTCVITSKKFIKLKSPLLENLKQEFYDQVFIDLEFEFSSLALPKIQEWLGLDAISERGTHYVARAEVPSNEALMQKLLSLGSSIKILSPSAITEEILIEAQRILNKYEK